MKVLLLTNFSSYSQNGIEYVMTMLKDEKVDYSLLNTYIEPYSSADMLISIRDIIAKQSEEELAIQAKSLTSFITPHIQTLTIRSEFGMLIQVISKIINTEHIDLIVIGTHGGEGLTKLFRGSISALVAQKINCPLLIVPEHYKYKRIEHVSLALGPNSLNTLPPLNPILDLTLKKNADLSVVHVQTTNEIMEREKTDIRIKNILGTNPYQFYDIKNEDVVEGINQFIKTMEIDMLAIVPGHYSSAARLFHRSTTKRIALSSSIPVMVLHEQQY